MLMKNYGKTGWEAAQVALAAVSGLVMTSAAAFAQSAPAAAPAAAAAAPAAAAAAPAAPAFNSGDTAWMLAATALVLMMTVPGLALYYGGMVRKFNVLATVMQSFAITCLVTVLWIVVEYSLAFTDGPTPWIGGLSRFMMNGLTLNSINPLAGTIPESVFSTYQLTFAIITPALICGSLVDRMKFSALLWFIGIWSITVYAVVAHVMWEPTGYFFKAGMLDFAGGTVVHVNSGIAGLVAALVLGKRKGYGHEALPPHNLVLSMVGASLLWVGWFGFNAGSAVAANANAGMAMLVTQIATGTAALAWMFTEWLVKGKPSVLGIISGAVTGLVAITPASGYVGPGDALWIGAVPGVLCYFSATTMKNFFGYDDSLDAFGVHAVGGMLGALLTGVFARAAIGANGAGTHGLLEGNAPQMLVQAEGIVFTLIVSGVGSFIILKIIDLVIGIRVDEDIERDGLDLALHGESVH